jgi:hypothetical protein
MAAESSIAAMPAAYARDGDRIGMECALERHAEYLATVR